MAEEKELTSIVDNFSKILLSLGDYLINMGEVEKSNPDFVDFVGKMKSDPEYFEAIISKLPPEESNEILSFFFQMIGLQSRAKDIENLTADEKINLGNDLKKLSEKHKNITKKMEKIK